MMDFIETAKSNAKEEKKKYSWETIPAPIPEEEIVETLEADVAIVGGGIAGLGTGARCTEQGLSVIVVEKYKGLVARGAHIASLDSRVMREHGITIDKEQFARDWMRICGSRVNEDLLWLYINKSEEAFEWLLDLAEGEVIPLLFGGNYKGPDFTEYAGTHFIVRTENSRYKYNGAMLMCEILQDKILAGGNQIVRNTRVEQLEKEGDRVVAFIAKGEDGKYRRYRGNKAVVLATGDIGGNPEMLEAFSPLGLKPKRNGYYPPGLNTGDGHKMAYWAGAAFEDPAWALSLHLIAYSLYAFFFLHVNRQGKRFMNEDTWVQAKAIRCLMQPEGDWAYSIFDAKWFDEVGERVNIAGGQFSEPLGAIYGQEWSKDNGIDQAIERYVKKGTCFKADTLEELAEQMEVPVENLKATVARYNELYQQGKDLDYGKRPELLTSIDKPPYYALKWGPALLNVHGGVIIDPKMRVMDKNDRPIPGLLAVGNVSGGLYGVDYPLLLNGNSHGRALVWAREATDTILEENK
ncbi:FAD-binding protein [Alkalibacter rhizosphaerae]|uniref:FAD-binding protein n=1 Tax=Alkalibacter rhizosphaerae TaxID=2815577 RepID=A0A974XGG6_9FIRM|nr:FAD-binding protein [Alkalibacter rhizosphaerae]QSX09432.1 FAD-binding protein [Alkalibacter rhizosphaerae]